MQTDTLYHDSQCPLCRAEIRRLARHTGDRLTLVDIHALQDYRGLPHKRDLLARLHLLTSDGIWLTGLEANIRAWQHSPYRRLWQMLEWPVVRTIAGLAYKGWLRNRARMACRVK